MLQIQASLKEFSNEELIAWTREIKEKRVNEYRKVKIDGAHDLYGGPEMQPHVLGWREGRLIYRAYTQEVDRDAGLELLSAAWVGLRLEQAAIILDAHMKQLETDTPEKKKLADEFLADLKTGDLQRACDDHGACELGEISDCMVIQVMGAGGTDRMITLPYRYHNGKTELDWSEDRALEITEDCSGVIPSAVKAIRKKADDMPALIRRLMKDDPQEADETVFRLLTERVREQELFGQTAKMVSGYAPGSEGGAS